IATVVSTRVLTPRMAVAWAAFFNFVAAFGFGVAVATTVGKGIVAPEVVDHAVIFAALVAAFLWDLITWRYGLPSSSSHALIAGLLCTSGYLGDEFFVPFWVILICHAAIALGTMFGGWRIVRTMGMRLTALQPLGGFCAETAGAIALLGSATLGIPVSTTHTITGAIVGVGSTRRLSAVRWGVAQNVVLAWILTIPCTATLAALVYLPLRLLRA